MMKRNIQYQVGITTENEVLRMLKLSAFAIVTMILAACGGRNHSTGIYAPKTDGGVTVTEAGDSVYQNEQSKEIRVYEVSDLHDARAAHTATLLNDGTVLITGGFAGRSSVGLSSVEIFDPSTKRFTKITPMLTARFDHSATLLPDGKVLIVGGYSGGAVATTEIYDPARKSFTAGPVMNTARYGHTATPLNDGRILFAGGVGTGWTFLSSAEIFDIEANRFIPISPMVMARESHTATLLNDGNVLITGGHRDRRDNMIVYSSSEIFDSNTATFSESGTLNIPRHKHDAALLPDGKVLIIGGANQRDSLYRSAEIYDPRLRTFTSTPDLNSPRFKFRSSSIALPGNNILIAGGSNKAEMYDVGSRRFKPIPGDFGVTRYFSGATLLNNGDVLVTGGYDDNVSATRKAVLFVMRE